MKSAFEHCVLSITAAAMLCLVLLASQHAYSQAAGQKTFDSSKEALNAFLLATRENNSADLQAILGPNSEQIISSGDDVADNKARDRFISRYDAGHSLVETAPHRFALNVGKDDWPLPIPLVEANNKWYWDGAAGREPAGSAGTY